MAPSTVSDIRGRLAPSPTGALHLGNARTFLLAWLSVRSRGGTVILRVEDVDGPRIKSGAEADLLRDLRWLGLDWDEGPADSRDLGGGPHAPYRQTARADLYQRAIDQLVAGNLAYPCVCTRSEIETSASAPNQGDHESRYPGTCRGRFINITEAGQTTGRPAALRLRVPDRAVEFIDGFEGKCVFNPAEECGDFVIQKVERSGLKAGVRAAAYQLACVLDDAAMGVSEVFRGNDLLSSTARQLLLYEALSLRAPTFVHTPLLVGPDGRRLAKRHGDTTLRRLRDAGAAPEAVIGYLAHVSGLCAKPARMTAYSLIGAFDLLRIPRAAVVVEPGIEQWILSVS